MPYKSWTPKRVRQVIQNFLVHGRDANDIDIVAESFDGISSKRIKTLYDEWQRWNPNRRLGRGIKRMLYTELNKHYPTHILMMFLMNGWEAKEDSSRVANLLPGVTTEMVEDVWEKWKNPHTPMTTEERKIARASTLLLATVPLPTDLRPPEDWTPILPTDADEEEPAPELPEPEEETEEEIPEPILPEEPKPEPKCIENTWAEIVNLNGSYNAPPPLSDGSPATTVIAYVEDQKISGAIPNDFNIGSKAFIWKTHGYTTHSNDEIIVGSTDTIDGWSILLLKSNVKCNVDPPTSELPPPEEPEEIVEDFYPDEKDDELPPPPDDELEYPDEEEDEDDELPAFSDDDELVDELSPTQPLPEDIDDLIEDLRGRGVEEHGNKIGIITIPTALSNGDIRLFIVDIDSLRASGLEMARQLDFSIQAIRDMLEGEEILGYRLLDKETFPEDEPEPEEYEPEEPEIPWPEEEPEEEEPWQPEPLPDIPEPEPEDDLPEAPEEQQLIDFRELARTYYRQSGTPYDDEQHKLIQTGYKLWKKLGQKG